MPVGTLSKVNWDAVERKAIYVRSCNDLSVIKGAIFFHVILCHIT
jgi:hypothetical protein